MLYSIVIPVYNSEKTLEELYNRLRAEFENNIREDFEIIFVNDASIDNSLAVIKKLCKSDERVGYIDFAKNHGQQKAVICGIDHSKGDFIITMDDDLQHPPEEIPKLIAKMESDDNIDVVIGMYDSKKHNGFRRLGTRLLDALSNMVFKKNKDLKLTSFRLMRSFVADNLALVDLKRPTVGHCLLLVDGNIVNAPVRHDARKIGKSGYGTIKLIRQFMENVYINTDFPLRVVGRIGTISLVSGLLLSVFYFIRYITGNIHVSGWTTLVIIVLVMNGLSLFSIGVIGRYLMTNINETKRLPKYSIRDKNVEKKRGVN
ncbi:MAG: glycosyltransferase family 2 protein [Clostridia bacterium]|nr:glycosyltransferase family 2 protein [Clostridia bacterium]